MLNTRRVVMVCEASLAIVGPVAAIGVLAADVKNEDY